MLHIWCIIWVIFQNILFFYNYNYDLYNNFEDFLSLVDPDTLDSYSESESLAGNFPETFSEPIDNLTVLAAALPLTCFDSTSPDELVTLIHNGKLKLSTLDDSRKIYIGTTVF